MHPILFKLPLPSFNLPYAWIPLIIAALAALVAIAKMIGKDKDRAGAGGLDRRGGRGRDRPLHRVEGQHRERATWATSPSTATASCSASRWWWAGT